MLSQDQNAGKLFADEAAAVYERAITTLLKDNMLLYFAYADFEEVSNLLILTKFLKCKFEWKNKKKK